MSYKQNASSNRDALFGSSSGAGKKKSVKAESNELFGGKSKSAASTSKTRPRNDPVPAARVPSSKGYQYGGKKKGPIKSELRGEAKQAKIKEADDYREKAKKAMQKGLFSKPDPLAASTYYKRAADAYQLCGESRLERMYRMSSADCQSKSKSVIAVITFIKSCLSDPRLKLSVVCFAPHCTQ